MAPYISPEEREELRLRPLAGWNSPVADELLGVVQAALADAPVAEDVPLVPANEDDKPSINVTRVLQRAEQDLAASEERVEERKKIEAQPDGEVRVRELIVIADARLIAAVRKLVQLGVRPEVLVEVMEGVLARE